MAASFQDLLGYITKRHGCNVFEALRCKSKSQFFSAWRRCESKVLQTVLFSAIAGVVYSATKYTVLTVLDKWGKNNLICQTVWQCGPQRSTVTEAFEHFAATVDEHFDELVATQKLSLDAVFNSRAIRDKPVWGSFRMNFLNRHFKRLDEKKLEQWKDWGRMISASDDYGATLRARLTRRPG